MIWHLLKYWVAFILPAFYKRIQAKNLNKLRVKGPAIIAMNHPNAFTDPVAISYLSYPLRLKYMARGDAFKPGIVAWLLRQIGIVPIFRVQDGGIEGLQKNDAAYRQVNSLLKKNYKVIVFAEGICVQERRLRPLKKGVARMVFGAYEALKADNLVVIPVGINYSKPDQFGSDVFLNVGEPIAIKDFIGQYRENAAKAQVAFLQTLYPSMKALITHIDNKDYDEVVYQVEELSKKNLIREQHLNDRNLEDDFIVLKQITEKVNLAVAINKTVVDEFKANAQIYFSELKQSGFEDRFLDPLQNKNVTAFYFCLRSVALCLGLPVYLIALIGNYPPYLLTKRVVKGILKGKAEFYSSLFVGFAMLFFLVDYLLLFTTVYIFADTVLAPILFCSVMALSALFCLHYRPFLMSTVGMLRILKNKKTAANLSEKRKNLVSLINKF